MINSEVLDLAAHLSLLLNSCHNFNIFTATIRLSNDIVVLFTSVSYIINFSGDVCIRGARFWTIIFLAKNLREI